MIDLHTHTTASDGTLTPEELIDYALEKGLHALAITDHDTIDALVPASKHLKSLSLQTNSLKLINGIELSTNLDGYSFDLHIVGLFLNLEDSDFLDAVKFLNRQRTQRNKDMIQKLQDLDYTITYDDLLAYCGKSTITRSHVANYLVDKGYFKDKDQVFKTLIGNDMPAYVPRKDISSEFGIQLILKNGGIPILAHPTLYPVEGKSLDLLVEKLVEHGLKGIETEYTLYTPEQTLAIKSVAKRFNLLESGGSDFHGSNKPGNDLAVGYGNLAIDDSFLTPMFDYLN